MKVLHVVFFLLFLSVFPSSYASEKAVARVFDQTIYQSDLSGEEDGEATSLDSLIVPTLLEKYIAVNHLSFEPTTKEREKFKAWFNKQQLASQIDSEKEEQERVSSFREAAKARGFSDEEVERGIDEISASYENSRPRDERMADFVLPHWKFQVYFYQNYGGGRILWQQRGMEAYDAFRNWLKEQEKLGNFEIFDQEDREAFYQYWNRSSGLITDKERIKEEFLEPAWQH